MNSEERFTVCTLYEGDYFHGVAALINSLVLNGFSGLFVIGHRGPLPPWLQQVTRLAPSVEIRFVALNTPTMLSNYKPDFMLRVLLEFDPKCRGVAYFDPDIVVDVSWKSMTTWMEQGVALCADSCFPVMEFHHHLRLQWMRVVADDFGWSCPGPSPSVYFNGGFVGIRRKDIAFLERWQNLMHSLVRYGADITRFKQHDRFHLFHVPDQDVMNAVAMTMPEALCSLGTEGMAFTPGHCVMWHAVENPKPWRRSFVLDLLRTGRPVPQAHRQFWKYADGPLETWSGVKLMWKRIDLWMAIFLSRFYHSA